MCLVFIGNVGGINCHVQFVPHMYCSGWGYQLCQLSCVSHVSLFVVDGGINCHVSHM